MFERRTAYSPTTEPRWRLAPLDRGICLPHKPITTLREGESGVHGGFPIKGHSALGAPNKIRYPYLRYLARWTDEESQPVAVRRVRRPQHVAVLTYGQTRFSDPALFCARITEGIRGDTPANCSSLFLSAMRDLRHAPRFIRHDPSVLPIWGGNRRPVSTEPRTD